MSLELPLVLELKLIPRKKFLWFYLLVQADELVFPVSAPTTNPKTIRLQNVYFPLP
jgi:hypothetical protein